MIAYTNCPKIVPRDPLGRLLSYLERIFVRFVRFFIIRANKNGIYVYGYIFKID